MNSEILLEICQVKMPYGKYKGTILADLPVSYLEWLARNGGFGTSKLAMQLATIYEIKINGLEEIIHNIKKTIPKNH